MRREKKFLVTRIVKGYSCFEMFSVVNEGLGSPGLIKEVLVLSKLLKHRGQTCNMLMGPSQKSSPMKAEFEIPKQLSWNI